MKAPNTHLLGKGIAKSKGEVLPTRDTTTGKRKVQINRNTWIYTRFDTDEEAIANYNRVHGITNQ